VAFQDDLEQRPGAMVSADLQVRAFDLLRALQKVAGQHLGQHWALSGGINAGTPQPVNPLSMRVRTIVDAR
jgi:hypothetical protein